MKTNKIESESQKLITIRTAYQAITEVYKMGKAAPEWAIKILNKKRAG